MVATTLSLSPGIFGIVGGFLAALVGAYGVWRKIEPERLKLRAEADKLKNEATSIEDRIRMSLLEDMETDRQRQREGAAIAQAGQAKAEARLAVALAEHADELAQWRTERHQLLNDLRAARLEVETLKRKIDLLEAEVRELRIQARIQEGRRADDQRFMALESDMKAEQIRNAVIEATARDSHARADVAEARADAAEVRADEAQLREPGDGAK